MHRLLSLSELIRDSWATYIRTWHKTLHLTSWFLILPLISFVLVLGTRSSEETSQALFGALSIVQFLLILWVTVRLYRWLLVQEKHIPEPADEARTAWMLVLPLLWTSSLKGLAVIGGLMVFFFPAIWLAVLLQFSELFLIGEGLRGTQALAASYHLVKGRWWEVFWRLIVPGTFFLIVSILLMSLFVNIVSLLAGQAKTQFIFTATAPSALIDAARQLLEGFAQMIFLPLFLIWQVKLFRSLKETR